MDASTIRLGLSWGYSLVMECVSLENSKEFQGLWNKYIEWDDISVSNALQHTAVKTQIE